MTDEQKDAIEQQRVDLANLSEAPASYNWYVTGADGSKGQFTLRDKDENKLLDRIIAFKKRLDKEGVSSEDDVVEELPVGDNNQGEYRVVHDGEFDCIELVGEMYKGNRSWKVTGGPYTKYGVRVWPEVLEEVGIMDEKLDIEKTYKMDKFVAFFVTNEKGNPQKVIKLEEK